MDSILGTASCTWEPMDVAASTCEHLGEDTVTQCEDEDAWARVQLEMCIQRDLRAVRLGPFVSLPGQWRSLSTRRLRGLLRDGDRVTRFVGGAVAEDGRLIGYPPLHAHHIHVRKGDLRGGYNASAPPEAAALELPTSREHASHWFEVHGDYGDQPDYGVGALSTRGYATTLPPGYCYLVSSADDLDVNAEINDVRVVMDELVDSSLEYYLLIAFQLSPDARCRPASKFWLRHPKSKVLTNDWWARYDAPRSPALTWWSGTFPAGGRLLHAWLHTHRSRDAGLLLLAASPEQIRFRCADLGISRRIPQGDLGISRGSAGDAPRADMRSVLTNLSRVRHEITRRGRVLCEDDDRKPTSVRIDSRPRDGIAADDYDRRGGLRCAEWRFAAGDPWTVVAFSDARFHTTQLSTPQHTELWMVRRQPLLLVPI